MESLFSKTAFTLLSFIPVLALHGELTGHEILLDTIGDHVKIQNFSTAVPTNIFSATSKRNSLPTKKPRSKPTVPTMKPRPTPLKKPRSKPPTKRPRKEPPMQKPRKKPPTKKPRKKLPTKKPRKKPTTIASPCEQKCNEFDEFKIDSSDYLSKISVYIDNPTGIGTSIGCWDTSELTTLNYAFYNKTEFNEDISCWETSKVTSMYVSSRGMRNMFGVCLCVCDE